jgi:hypothetical protein
MAYLYRHIRLDKNVPFYVGIGDDKEGLYKRAFTRTSRNVYWRNIVKVTDYDVEILLDNLSWKDACEKEKEFISIYKKYTEGGTLTNIADGGQGGFLSEEINEKRRNTLKGHFVSEITKQKIANSKIGKKLPESTKEKMSQSHKGKKLSWIKSDGHNNGRAYKVYQYTKDMVFIREWECAKYAIKYYSMNKTAITDCLRGRQKTAKGYIWTKNIIQNA